MRKRTTFTDTYLRPVLLVACVLVVAGVLWVSERQPAPAGAPAVVQTDAPPPEIPEEVPVAEQGEISPVVAPVPEAGPPSPREVQEAQQAGLTVTGRVVDTSGQPIAGAVVTTDGARSDEPAEVVTDGSGRFRVAGTHGAWIRAQHPAYQKGEARIPNVNGTIPDLEIVLMGFGVLEGRVLNDGKPVAGAKVRFPSAGGATDDQGWYRLERVIPGFDFAECTVGGTQLRQMAVIEENQVTVVDFSLPAMDCTISGLVTVTGQPAVDASVTVRVFTADGSVERAAHTGTNGAYATPALPPGDAVVAVEYRVDNTKYTDKALITLASRQESRVDFDLGQTPGRIAGTFACEEGAQACLVQLLYGRVDIAAIGPHNLDYLEAVDVNRSDSSIEPPGGEFALDEIAPGLYTVIGVRVPTDAPRFEDNHEAFLEAVQFTSQVVNVMAGEEAWVELKY